jgi:thiamine biosynthesis protein ThiC
MPPKLELMDRPCDTLETIPVQRGYVCARKVVVYHWKKLMHEVAYGVTYMMLHNGSTCQTLLGFQTLYRGAQVDSKGGALESYCCRT